MQKKRILYLDLTRIVCFLMVTSFHFSIMAGDLGIDAPLKVYTSIMSIGWGAIATSSFFMISGAALIYSYRETFSLKEYYKKRFFGLYPLFWLTYLFAFLNFFYRYKTIPAVPKINILFSVFGMDGYFLAWIPTFYMIGEWFLGALVMLYLLFPLYRVVMCKCKYILPALLFIASAVLFYHNPFPMAIDQTPVITSMYFVLGMLIEMLRESPRRAVRIGRGIAAVFGVLVYVFVFVMANLGYRYPPNMLYPVHFSLSLLFYLIMMEAAEWVKSARVQKLIGIIGKHSYAYFLIHHLFLQQYLEHFAGTAMNRSNTLLLFLSNVAYTYVLAVLLDKLYAAIVRSLRKWRAAGKE